MAPTSATCEGTASGAGTGASSPRGRGWRGAKRGAGSSSAPAPSSSRSALEGGAALGAPPGVAQLEALTHLFGERSAVRGLRRKQANLLKRHGRTQRTLDEVLGFHASHRIEAPDKCSALDVGNGQT